MPKLIRKVRQSHIVIFISKYDTLIIQESIFLIKSRIRINIIKIILSKLLFTLKLYKGVSFLDGAIKLIHVMCVKYYE